MCFSCVCLFILHKLISVRFPSSWCQGLAAVCDCDNPWTFLLAFFSYGHTWDN